MTNKIEFILEAAEFDCPSCGRWNKTFGDLWFKQGKLYDGGILEVICYHCEAPLIAYRSKDSENMIKVKDISNYIKLCGYCKEPKQIGTTCIGNDECNYGPNGKAAEACLGWSDHWCCRCGSSYAIGQM